MTTPLDQLSKEVMPFGKYKGKPFDIIPYRYFWWLLEQQWLKPVLKYKIEAYLDQPVIQREIEKMDREREEKS